MMPEAISFRQKVDNFLTDYLRNTTTDQEILNFYGRYSDTEKHIL